MLLIVISFSLFIYSVSVQIYRAVKKDYKKTPQYKAFEKELKCILKNHKVKTKTS